MSYLARKITVADRSHCSQGGYCHQHQTLSQYIRPFNMLWALATRRLVRYALHAACSTSCAGHHLSKMPCFHDGCSPPPVLPALDWPSKEDDGDAEESHSPDAP